MSTMSAREFNQDVTGAKRAARDAPVIITDRGEPAFVLLSIEEFRRLRGPRRTIVEMLSMDDDIDFEPGRLEFNARVPDL
jgi:prevent-host-death family protein